MDRCSEFYRTNADTLVCNTSTIVPDKFIEDVKKFTVANVADTAVEKQFTEMITAREYIIKEVRIFFGGTVANDAYFHLNMRTPDVTGSRFAEGYYNEGSFVMFSGNRNGNLNDTLKVKPYIFVTAGTGTVAQTVYGSVHYYYV